MKKRISRILGLIMLIIAIAFIVFALNHPEMSFPWNNTITWLLYGLYILVTVMLLKSSATVNEAKTTRPAGAQGRSGWTG